MERGRFFVLVGFMILILAWPGALLAQSGRGTITGVVKDSSGSIVPAAEIAATNQNTGVETKGITTEAGVFRFPYVMPGKYQITASKSGFKTASRENVEVLIAQTVTADFILEVGEMKEVINISAENPLLEASTSEIGTNASELEVHAWPIQVGDGTRQLQTFVFNSLPGAQGNPWAGSINGSQAFSHEILMDGISIGRMDINGGNNSEFTPTVDSVSEFKLQTGSVSSQYGNTQTGLANFALKSGGNQFHGTAYWFYQSSVLNANTWSNNAQSYDPQTGKAVKAKNHLNNGGGTVSGPIRKDKTFFFFGYEAHRIYGDQECHVGNESHQTQSRCRQLSGSLGIPGGLPGLFRPNPLLGALLRRVGAPAGICLCGHQQVGHPWRIWNQFCPSDPGRLELQLDLRVQRHQQLSGQDRTDWRRPGSSV
jgi:hypothetical protein